MNVNSQFSIDGAGIAQQVERSPHDQEVGGLNPYTLLSAAP